MTISGVADFGYLADVFCRELGLGPKINKALRRSIERRCSTVTSEIWTRFSVATGDVDLLVIHNDEDDVVDPRQAPVLLAVVRAASALPGGRAASVTAGS